MKAILLSITGVFICLFTLAQVGISTTGNPPDASAMLEVKSTTKGTLLTRMTSAQLAAITGPADGLQVYCTTDGKMYIYVALAGVWKELAYGAGTITPPFSCGLAFTVVHATAGNVAPVNKSVTYATANNIPGEPSKCWITRNLGASQQATNPADATEASAGWYWQFNRKQGFQHDGTTRTPATTWVTGINDNQNWLAASDPCTLELGPAWRIPIYSEWANVMSGGGWGNWIGPYNSALKLHAAGVLSDASGALSLRGSYGFYWSSIQYNAVYGYCFRLQGDMALMDYQNKSAAFPLRCIRDF